MILFALVVIVSVIGIIQTVDATSVVATISVGPSAGGIAYDSTRGEMFVTNPGENTVSVISTSSNTVIATIPVGKYPLGIAYDSGKGEMFVTNSMDNTVSVINDATRMVVATIPVGSWPWNIAYDSTRGEMFVVNYGRGSGNTVSVISDETNSVVDTITVGRSAFGIAYDSTRGEMFVTNPGENTVSIIEDQTRTVVATIPVGSNPHDIAYDSGKGKMFVINPGDRTVSVINDATKMVVATIPVSSIDSGIAYDSSKGQIFVGKADRAVSVISDETNSVVETINMLNKIPYSIAYDTSKRQMFVVNEPAGVNASVHVIKDEPDTIPPVIVVPSNMIVNLNSTSIIPTPVTFSFTATDNVGVVTQSCNPSSGSTFPIGISTVICTATDKAGNLSKASFTITVNKFISIITDTDGDGLSDSLDPCPFTIATNCESPKKIKVTLPLNFKNTASAWSSGKITDNQFLQLVQIEINRGTMIIPDVKINDKGNSGTSIPSWAKNNVGWWADGTIDDISYIATIQYFYKDGILPVKVTLKDIPVQKPVLKPEPVPELVPEPEPVSTKKIITVEESGFTQGCVKSGCYTPVSAKVSVGSVVTMTNTDTTGVHTFTSGTVDGFTPSPDGIFDSGVLMNGDSFTWKANVSGKVPYYCMLHTWMTGTIIVGEAKADELKADEKRLAEEKRLADAKKAEEKRLADAKKAEEKALADKKIADEKKAADKKIADKKIADKKIADKKIADKKAADKKAADKKIADANKAADKKAADKKAAEAKKAQK